MPVTPDPPTRSKDRYVVVAREWRSGCLLCEEQDLVTGLPGCTADLGFPLCARHLRWAMASRRERVGHQALRLKRLLLAWCRVRERDGAAAREWLGY